jgi:hypothetical protein
MTSAVKRRAVPALRWTLGLTVLLQSVHFALGPGAADFAEHGLPPWLRLGLGGSEVLAAILFLIPPTEIIGGYALLGIFAVAVGLHFMRQEYGAASLAVYAIAVLVCMSGRDGERPGAP